jgi:hypothetical protein
MVYYLNDLWALYFHDPYDMNWDEKSYKFLCTMNSVDDFINTFIVFRDLWSRGMFFIMREHIMPRWEHEENKNGGCFSYKIMKPELDDKWFNICSQVLGEILSDDDNYTQNINGISISPKKNYYIIRIWLKDNKKSNKDMYKFDIPKYSTLMYKSHSLEFT